MARADVLLAGYLDRDLDAAETAELLALVRADAAVRAAFLDLTRQERQLAAELGPIALEARVMAELARPDPAWVEGVMGEVRQVARRPVRRARPAPRRSNWPMLAFTVAGLAAVLVLAWVVIGRQGEPAVVPPVADMPKSVQAPVVLATVTGTLQVAGRSVAAGTELHAGDLVASQGEGGWTYADGSAITVGTDTEAVLGLTAAGKRVDLHRGRLAATVAKQPDGQPLVVATPQLVATVVGTRFTIESRESSRLEVAEGCVRVTVAGRSEDVAAGQAIAVGADGIELTIWSLAGRWQQVISGGTPGAEAITSIATAPGQRNQWFDPDQYICLQGGRGDDHNPLFRVPEHVQVRLRLRAEHDGEAMLTLQAPLEEPGGHTNHGGRRFAVGPAWREVVLAGDEFKDDTGASGFVAGYPVWTACVWAFRAGVIEVSSFTVERLPPAH